MITEVDIHRLGLEGQGVGYDLSGNIYFVPGAVPGDRVKIDFAESRKRYRDADLVEVLSPSPSRREPICRYFGECGGCDFLHWSYEAQLQGKRESLTHAIERAGWDPNVVEKIVPSPEEFGYRNRIQIRRDSERTGFYRRGSHEIVDIEQCIVAHPKINKALYEIRASPAPSQGYEKIEIAITKQGDAVSLKNQPHAAAGFQQVNAEQSENLRRIVAEAVGDSSRKVLELYCGDGNLTFAFLSRVQEVLAIDSSEISIRSARERKKGSQKVAFLAMPVDHKLSRQLPAEFQKKYDTLVVDPPRQGMGQVLEFLLHPQLEKVIYISCSPVTFSKDSQVLRKNYVLSRVYPLDMFPHTRHIEFVSVFSRLPHSS